MLLTTTFAPEEYERALRSWRWLPVEGKAPVMASLFGDVFLEDASGCWFLDTIDGTLSLGWGSIDELRAVLETEEGEDRYLLGALARAANDDRGLVLQPGQVYDIVPPPILGGSIAVENLSVFDFVVSVDVKGQLHRQLSGTATEQHRT